jgi:hypothetical protein
MTPSAQFAFANTAYPPASTPVEMHHLAHQEFLIKIEAITSVPL